MKRSLLSGVSAPLIAGMVCALVALALFAGLAEEMLEGETRQFDTAVRQFVHSHASDRMTAAMKVLTFLGSTIFVSVAATTGFLALWFTGRRRKALLIAITIAGGGLLMWVLKMSFHRQRPPPFFDTPLPASYSFPSGHALLSFCLYGAGAALLTADLKNIWARIAIWTLAAVLVLGVGLSRIYLGVHYPSDVVAGYLGALAWVLGVGTAYRSRRRLS